MAADQTLDVSRIEAPNLPFSVPTFAYIPIKGFKLSRIEVPVFGGGGGSGPPPRPSSGFIYPRGDY